MLLWIWSMLAFSSIGLVGIVETKWFNFSAEVPIVSCRYLVQPLFLDFY